MRKSREETATTRHRIVESSAKEFRRLGIDGSGLTGLMAAAGLTQGGFYKHFASKAQLVGESVAVGVDGLITSLRARLAEADNDSGFDTLVSGYLSQAHRDEDVGCPYAGLGSELARAEGQVRSAAVDGFERMLGLLAEQLADQSDACAREQALFAMCAMMGALTVSRMAEGRALSDEVLSVVGRRLRDVD
jgi:TetR/AcrR family transcriptional repressor of nem operon